MLVACLGALLCVSWPAQAQNYQSEVANGLKQSIVYVAPGTEHTDFSTIAQLRGSLNKEDHVYLAMLPSSASAEVGDLTSFAADIVHSLGNQAILGLAVGDQTLGYSTAMPSGTADDLMHRAASVSSSPVETLGTFARNVHNWQADHPEARTSHSSSGDGLFWLLMAALIVCIIGLLVALARVLIGKKDDDPQSRKRFKAPHDVSELLHDIACQRERVHDRDLQHTLYVICCDVERYFDKYSSQKDKSGDAATFTLHLRNISGVVLEKYIEAQDNPRDYRNPKEVMEKAKATIDDFSEFVLTSIQNGADEDLVDFHVSTDLMLNKRFL